MELYNKKYVYFEWDDTTWNYPTYGYCFGGK